MSKWQDEQRVKSTQEALDLADCEWLTNRMLALVTELKELKEPRRLAYVQGCLNAAMKAHARIVQVRIEPGDFE